MQHGAAKQPQPTLHPVADLGMSHANGSPPPGFRTTVLQQHWSQHSDTRTSSVVQLVLCLSGLQSGKLVHTAGIAVAPQVPQASNTRIGAAAEAPADRAAPAPGAGPSEIHAAMQAALRCLSRTSDNK